MHVTTDMRKSVRVKIKNGQLRIHHPIMPAITCELLDLSDGGAGCRMHTDHLDHFAAQVWRELLGSGKSLKVEFVIPGQNQPCQIICDIRHLRLQHEGEIEFGFSFQRPDPLQREIVRKSIEIFAESTHERLAAATSRPKTTTAILKAPKPPSSNSTIRTAPVATAPPKPAPPKKRKTFTELASGLFQAITGSGNGAAVDYRGMKVGEILMRTGRLTPKQAVEAYEKSKAAGQKFGRYLLANDIVSPAELTRALSLQSALPIVDLATVTMPDTVKELFEHETMTKHEFVPFNQFGTTVYIACKTPLSKAVLKELEQHCKMTIKLFLAQDDVVSVAQNSGFFPKATPKKAKSA